MDDFFKNLPKDTTMMIHSSMSSLGTNINMDSFIDKIIEASGEKSTIVMPTFSFDFSETKIFNPDKTKSNNGLLTEKFRLRKDVSRTLNPMQSLAVYGNNKEKYLSSKCKTTFGENSMFDMMYKDDSYIVLIGVDYNKTTFYHYLEEKYKVPYRFWKSFDGNIEQNGLKKEIIYKMFVRNLEYMPNINHYGLLMEELGMVNKFFFYNSIVRIFKVKDMYHILKQEIEKNPYSIANTDRDFWKIGTVK